MFISLTSWQCSSLSCSDNKDKEQTGRTHSLAGSDTDSPFGGADREEEEGPGGVKQAEGCS